MVCRLLLAVLLITSSLGGVNWVTTPVEDPLPTNQLSVSGNACGPACLLNAFRSGNHQWQKSLREVEGDDDQSTMINIIKKHGRKPSRLDQSKARWNTRQGISAPDLVDIANEMRTSFWMRKVKQTVTFSEHQKPVKDQELLLKTHQQLKDSLKRGLPPILSLRRVSQQNTPSHPPNLWLTVKRHFVVLTGLPDQLPRDATSFQVTYHDPWGGHHYSGNIRLPKTSEEKIATLIADFPNAEIGKKLLKPEQTTSLSLSSILGLL